MNLNSVTPRNIFIAVILFVVTALTCSSQPSQQVLRSIPREMFFEAHLLPAESGMVRMVVAMQTHAGALSFTKSSSLSSYCASFSLTLECTDSLGVIRNSVTKPDSVVVTSFAETRSSKSVINRVISCIVTPSVYKATLIVEQSGATIARWTSADVYMTNSKRREIFTSPLICESRPSVDITNRDSVYFNPVSLGSKVEFSDRNATFVSHVSGVAEDEQWVWSCTRASSEHLLIPGAIQPLSGTCTVMLDRNLVPAAWNTKSMSSNLLVVPDATHLGVALVCADIPSSKFSPGVYRFVLRCPATGDSVVREFQCFWPAMPQSFQLEAQMLLVMRYLLTVDDYEDMADGSEAEVRRRCFDWWRKFDPNPATPYNQAMTACFTRADEAASTYKSAMEPNGIRTERGRVYILFGSPDVIRTERITADTQRETWTYTSRLKRKVTFEIDERGVYSIAKVEE
ncbi:MAG: GWxTD domain-containing protein [Candidatus Kapaibacterium sp.]